MNDPLLSFTLRDDLQLFSTDRAAANWTPFSRSSDYKHGPGNEASKFKQPEIKAMKRRVHKNNSS